VMDLLTGPGIMQQTALRTNIAGFLSDEMLWQVVFEITGFHWRRMIKKCEPAVTNRGCLMTST
jgi:hypothetical protein